MAPTALQVALLKYGLHLQVPGQERLIMTGLAVRGGSAPTAFQLIRQLPNLVSYKELGGSALYAITFNGSTVASAAGAVQQQDLNLIETFAYDTPECLFLARSNGLPTRRLGSHFRPVPTSATTYTGPTYDVYAVDVSVQQPGEVKQELKYYHVDSGAQVLSMVRYAEAGTNVEVDYSGWTTDSNNLVPATITRSENGVQVLSLTIQSATFGPAAVASTFQIAGQ